MTRGPGLSLVYRVPVDFVSSIVLSHFYTGPVLENPFVCFFCLFKKSSQQANYLGHVYINHTVVIVVHTVNQLKRNLTIKFLPSCFHIHVCVIPELKLNPCFRVHRSGKCSQINCNLNISRRVFAML